LLAKGPVHPPTAYRPDHSLREQAHSYRVCVNGQDFASEGEDIQNSSVVAMTTCRESPSDTK
jgi:hypothetical protein